MKIPPSLQLKAVAKHILNFFGGTPTVHAYYDDARARSMSIVTTLDTVEPGFKSIGTIGLSEVPLVHDDGTEFITRIELCSAVPSHVEAWENVIASAVFSLSIESNLSSLAEYWKMPSTNTSRTPKCLTCISRYLFFGMMDILKNCFSPTYRQIGCSALQFTKLKKTL
ncbi:Antitoxin YqcF [Pseudomonas syringae pv. actinidiae]|nr:Antitoxin YqcF [Pseudomonas syringae pv. actinidiae]